MPRHTDTRRWGALASASVLSLGLLLAGCNNETAAGRNTTSSVAASSETHVVAERREAVFSVPGMNCPTCPITVRRALINVDGVFEAEASLQTKQARATFDPKRTDPQALIQAIENSGFSAQLKDSGA